MNGNQSIADVNAGEEEGFLTPHVLHYTHVKVLLLPPTTKEYSLYLLNRVV